MISWLFGGDVYSEFRLNRLVHRLRESLGYCQDIRVQFVYFIDHWEEIKPQQLEKIGALLGVEKPKLNVNLIPAAHDHIDFFVVPRVGTISPWSSKATDILRLCELQSVQRVERGTFWQLIGVDCDVSLPIQQSLKKIVYDPMTQSLCDRNTKIESLFKWTDPSQLSTVNLIGEGRDALIKANQESGFSMNSVELDYLVDLFRTLGRNPTDAELMMFAQVNSEHCRHKIFNSSWRIDGHDMENSLFEMVKQTHAANPDGTLTAYSDNAAIIKGDTIHRLSTNLQGKYSYIEEMQHFTIKVETHNHPVAISPYPGAATGSGGEIRDEAATGRGGRPRAGLVGFSVSHLHLPQMPLAWELPESRPSRIASPLQIMLEAPVGAAAYNNEFGRPCISGYFRVFESKTENENIRYGYHKPIMLAGGIGGIRSSSIQKKPIPVQSPIVVLGGPGMLIGLGGGSASSATSKERNEDHDWASVQRDNAEMQRRCQEVINACSELGFENPILAIHDVGAGGLCNAVPELLEDSGCGGVFELRNIPTDDPSMSPMQIWCNESQERYVLAIERSRLKQFQAFCQRERCPYAVIGEARAERQLSVSDSMFKGGSRPIDLSMSSIFDFVPRLVRDTKSNDILARVNEISQKPLEVLLDQVLSHPTVADKTFLITIGDRTVTGLIARDQMVGPWQVPVADVGVVASGYHSKTGQAIGIGERTPLAVLDAQASGRMAIGEAITNLSAAAIGDIEKIRLSANWMVAAGEPGHDADLFHTVRSITQDICTQLGISIPVGKDSMSMRTEWQDSKKVEKKVIAPLSLIASGFAPVWDVGLTLTPQLVNDDSNTLLLLIDLGVGKNRLGGSILAETLQQSGEEVPDLDNPESLRGFFQFLQSLIKDQLVLAYHDRSDGGLITTVCEMMFAGRCGISLYLNHSHADHTRFLFNEELGAIIQIKREKFPEVLKRSSFYGIKDRIVEIGTINSQDCLNIYVEGDRLLSQSRTSCQQAWSSTSWQMQRLRDNPFCADQEYLRITDQKDPGLFCDLPFAHDSDTTSRSIGLKLQRPKIAILREQGVNGHVEMAAAFEAVGFTPYDVTMTDILGGLKLHEFTGFVACGGFSFGDVLGAGAGWGKSILYNDLLKDEFTEFFSRSDTFGLGVCNGCQMLACIQEIIPGAEHWPDFVRNTSEQYEGRFIMVKIVSETSILTQGMQGSMIPVPTSHGEGRVKYRNSNDKRLLEEQDQVCMRFVDNCGYVTERYPWNPNGSPEGATGFTSRDGRFTILMPHPERVFLTNSNSWHPQHWRKYSPWIKLFRNARTWVG
ncbi:MAG: phosphoribosylformylglycinamidine synthase [Gammaproteobacteria bacterium]|nr:phosphoribosylformylglycinamidine synthase [Gammaproteobacteria bacterium]